MTVLIILAHPNPDSYNHAIANTCKNRLIENNYRVILHDLYEEAFDPLLLTQEIPKDGLVEPTIETHCRELKECVGIIIIHPNWWGQSPAILKGWIDRVIRPGVAYEFEDGDQGEGIPIGLLKGKTALVFNTSNTSEERENNLFKDPLETIWKVCIFGLCRIESFERKMFRIIVTSDPEQRKNWLNEVVETLDRRFPCR